MNKIKSKALQIVTYFSKLTLPNILRLSVYIILTISLLYISFFGYSRHFIIIALLALTGLLAIWGIIFESGVKILKTSVALGLTAFVVSVFLSGLFGAGSIRESFFGLGVELDTVSFIFLWAIFVAVISGIISTNKQVFHFLQYLFIASGLTVLLTMLNILILPKSIFFNPSSVTIGVLSVVIVALSAFMRQFFLELCNHNLYFNVGSLLVGLIGVAGLFFANNFILWVIVGTFSLIMVAYAFIKKTYESTVQTPWVSIILFFVVLSGLLIGGLQQNWNKNAGLSYQNGPSLSSTLVVTRSTLQEYPVFGIGGNHFAYLWDMYKPARDIVSPQSSQKFNVSFGYWPTFISTTGIIGLFGLITFLFLFISLGVKIIRDIIRNKKDDPLTLITWMLGFVMLSITIVTTADITVLLITGLVIGLALASSMVNGHISSVELTLRSTYKKIPYIFMTLIGVFVLILFFVYMSARDFSAIKNYQKFTHSSINSIEKIQKLSQITKLNPYDAYFRGSSEQYLASLFQYIQNEEAQQENIQALVQGATSSAQSAVNANKFNYLNYKNAGDVYRQLGVLGVQGAFEEAEKTYKIALEHKPYSSDVLLSLARTHLQQKNFNHAKYYTYVASEISPSNAAVYATGAHIAIQENDETLAKDYLIRAVQLQPNNVQYWRELGIILFSIKDYKAAANVFTQAINITGKHQDLYYYLGLSLKELGKNDEVQKIYDFLKKSGATVPIENLTTQKPAVVEMNEEQGSDLGALEVENNISTE